MHLKSKVELVVSLDSRETSILGAESVKSEDSFRKDACLEHLQTITPYRPSHKRQSQVQSNAPEKKDWAVNRRRNPLSVLPPGIVMRAVANSTESTILNPENEEINVNWTIVKKA